ncbi:MAG: TetR/AcrR family transcriptional regulator [Deltaproteobacteria bacterium]|nr:TetR/AcrR family transcriptional regulator [Deltaproteobacteria bacterium]
MPTKRISKTAAEASAEERILAAAKAEFASNGFYGARTQAIADTAGVNKAMLHYYFRSKENLYSQVIQAAFRKILSRLGQVWLEPGPLKARIEMVVDTYMDNYEQNPGLLKIILREVQDGGEHLRRAARDLRAAEFLGQGFNPAQVLARAAEELGLSPKDTTHFLVNLVGMCAISFIAPLILESILDFRIPDMKTFLKDRRKAIKAMVLASVDALTAEPRKRRKP